MELKEKEKIRHYLHNSLMAEIEHIFDSGANEIRVKEMVVRFISNNKDVIQLLK